MAARCFSEACAPPIVIGPAALVTAAMQGAGMAELCAMIDRNDADPVARLFDTATLTLIGQRRADALALQHEAIAASPLTRIHRDSDGRAALRLLALVSPGDLMANTPLDFITNSLNVRLDLVYLVAGQDLPAVLPDHDVMFFAASEPDGPTLARMQLLFASWPRPVLNDPGLLPRLARDRLANLLAEIPGICSPRTASVGRDALEAGLDCGAGLAGFAYPILVRPHGSHAGEGLAKIDDGAALAAYLQGSDASQYYVTTFVDYRTADGLYRKYRVAFIDRAPHLCHLAVSSHWMVHYLNAGMTEDAGKRQDEADAMAHFDTGFGARHSAAFAALHAVLAFDYYSIDCSETPDGRLLVFEADTAAIIHNMDCAEMFAYKHTQMRAVFGAFGEMLTRKARQDVLF
jgi:hypothetical protein